MERVEGQFVVQLSSIRGLANARWKFQEKIPIKKQDLLTIAVLSIVFFTVATWNLGAVNVPLSTWQVSDGETFYINLGTVTTVKAVYFLIKEGQYNLTVFNGFPGNWRETKSNVIFQDYYKWNEIGIHQTTQYVKFTFQQSSAEIAEIAVLGEDNQKIAITAIGSEGSENLNLPRLIDEQEKVECPPTYLSETYFDEIYYVRTAEEYIKIESPYEWTHPPLGKLLLAFGILVFGYDPFGWRIMGVIFATLMIPVIYILWKKLFGTWIGAFASAFLLTFDFMHFTMGRMATVDTYVVFFSLTSQLFFLIYFKDVLKNGWKASVLPLFLAVLFFSLGFSTKWLGLYGFAAQIVLLLALRLKDVIKLKEGLSMKVDAFFDHPFSMMLGFLMVAAFVYLLTFIPYMLAGHTLADVFQIQWSMYIYHATLKATHLFSSQWWSWPLMLKPVWLCVSYLPSNIVSTIVVLENPVICWVGFAFILLAVERAVRGKDFACLFITVFFFFQWLPYVFISRITFLYHFYVNLPFLCLATSYFISKYWTKKWGKAAAIAYFVGVVVLFGLFYPAISGSPAPSSWIDSLKWLGSWFF